MIKSMTGYGEGTASKGARSVRIEINTINRRQLDVQIRLPNGFSSFEPAIHQQVQSHLSRGRVSVFVSVEESADLSSQTIRPAHAQDTVEQLRSMARTLNLSDDLSASDLLKIPNLFEPAKRTVDLSAFSPLMERALSAAMRSLNEMRKTEGKHLATDLRARLEQLDLFRKEIACRAPNAFNHRSEKLQKALKDDGFEIIATDERLLKELAFYAERADISEELTRLASHLKQVRACLRSAGAVGRELDFLVQELLREINTIGSKANDLEITRRVVAFKTELERIREQVQNIE